MFILSKHLLVQGWFGGVKQSSERCLSVAEVFWTGESHLVWQNVLYLITSWGVSRAQPNRTQPSGMELLAKTVNSLRPMTAFTETFFFDVWLGSG